MRRAVLILALSLCVPLAAQAADGTDTSTANPLQATGQAGASPQTSGLLQPATSANSPLQSADAGSGGISQSPTGSNLQQTGSGDQIKLLIQGEGDTPKQLDVGPDLTWLGYILMVLVGVTALTAIIVVLQRSQA